MPDSTSDRIDEILDKPKDVQIDGTRIMQHSIPDLIALEKHRSRKAASPFGFRMTKLTPPAHIGEEGD